MISTGTTTTAGKPSGGVASRRAVGDSAQASLAAVDRVVAIASGKGGVGKSTTAVNIAYALADKGLAVGLLDADIFGPSIPLMTARVEPVVYPKHSTNPVQPPQLGGVKVISIAMFQTRQQANILRGPMAAAVIRQFLGQVAWGKLDYLIIDYPPGTSDIQLTLSQAVALSGAVLVTTPQDVALRDVEKALSLFATTSVPVLGIVETMSSFICDGCQKEHHVFLSAGGEKLARKANVPLLGEIPLETNVVLTSDRGIPMVRQFPNSMSAVAYRKAVDQIEAQLTKVTAADDTMPNFHLVWQTQEGGQR